jgi:hypothetical protein
MRSQLADTEAMRAAKIRYLVLREQTIDQFEPGLHGEPAAIIVVADRPVLQIYDLWDRAPAHTEVIDAAVLRPRFYQTYAGFRMLREFRMP